MSLVIKGRIVPLSGDRGGSADDTESFAGRVWIGEDGKVAAVTRGRRAGPSSLPGAREVDVGDALVFPGLVDLHNHLGYDTLPLWAEPDRTKPFLHHDIWPGESTYAPSVTWPAYALMTAAPEELLAYVETKALVGGTTTIQGSPPKNRRVDGWLVRNVDDETFGTGEADLVLVSTLGLPPETLARRAGAMRRGSLFVYHCAEGQPGTIVAREFQEAARHDCLQPRFVAVHCNAVDAADVGRAWEDKGSVVWSPFSNLWLYGTTTDVPALRAAGLHVCLGSDWSPSGTKNVLGELKVARLVADDRGWALSDADLVRMVTTEPGDVLFRGWGRQVGRLQPGSIGDVVVVAARRRSDPFATLLRATERDIRLVVVEGRPRYGTPDLMTQAGAEPTSRLDLDGERRLLSLTRRDDSDVPWTWGAVVDRLEQVRADPKGEVDAARNALLGYHGRWEAPGAPLRLALDMPTGAGPLGGLPKDVSKVVVPPLQSLVHDADWLGDIAGRGFHGGLLDRLASFYR